MITMGIFYYDEVLMAYEASYQWDQALKYLERLYLERRKSRVLYSLIGFSWYYLIEGPVVSKLYAADPNTMALKIWKKYIDVGVLEAYEDPFFNFIAGYTLSLHGYYIGEEYENKGSQFLKACLSLTSNDLLQQMAENYLINEHSDSYTPVKNRKSICARFFNGKSLLDKYFNEIYGTGDGSVSQSDR